ncbi:hypothetical protein ACFP2T_32330 [Plantactinospora solaniradicis]|uniref:DUF4192 domain-containing protein n=1 Tax=Plantactinospora solaniradicis TaxID=1723736 RepID=A0ABW1KGI3_9ACTN
MTVHQLDSRLAGASTAVVREVSGEVLITTSEPGSLAELRRALAVTRVLDMVCVCAGEYRVEFVDDGGERVATVGHHHAYSLRWKGFSADAELRDGTALLRWLSDRGIPHPLDRFHAEQARQAAARAASEVAERSWRAAAAVPGEVVDAILGSDPPTTAELLQQVRGVHRTDSAVALALLAWCGSGTGRYSGYPSHEGVPSRLLAELPIAAIAEALAGPEATDEHFAGAVRHLTGWQARKRLTRDIGRLPTEIRARLVAVGQQAPDPAIRSRSAAQLA